MNILYSKYSRERLPEYQINTSIINDNYIYVSKTALTKLAYEHIKRIYTNFELLNSVYTVDSLAKPLSYDGKSVQFEYIQGQSMDQIMIQAIMKKDKKEIYERLDVFKELLEGIAGDNYCEFYHTSEFLGMFGERGKLNGLKSFTISNIDFNFDNIVKDASGALKVIDYEWICPFPVPLNFIKFRAINNFYYSHYYLIRNFIEIHEMFSYLQVPEDEISDYTEMSNRFADMIGTEREAASINKYLKAAVPLQFSEPLKNKAQLFYSQDQQFSEERSLVRFVNESSTSIVFDLNESKQLSYVRFDPLDSRGIVTIKNITLIDLDNQPASYNEIFSNACLVFNGMYVFIEDDPQIVFNFEFKRYKKIAFEVEYYTSVPQSVLLEFYQNYSYLHDRLKDAENNLILKGEFITNLENEKNNVDNLLISKRLEAEQLSGLLADRIQDVNVFKQTLEKTRQELNQLQVEKDTTTEKLNQSILEIELLKKELQEANDKLTYREMSLAQIHETKWWKLRLFFIRMFSKKIK